MPYLTTVQFPKLRTCSGVTSKSSLDDLRHGVPELRIVGCQNQRVEVHADAKGGVDENVTVADDTVLRRSMAGHNALLASWRGTP